MYIDAKQICSVLLADGWHTVADGTFDVGEYEYHSGPGKASPGTLGGSQVVLHGSAEPLVSTKGFGFKEELDNRRRFIYGPVTSILAVRYG